ncbi:MAG: hypothetical protein PHF97_02820 [Bacteroidales bacterium]|nr:OprO/OprP family phosphate-selective porin [Bacteroidales bacterium]MDD4602726.1 hypothetical protein [Bacteroidales bacterium]
MKKITHFLLFLGIILPLLVLSTNLKAQQIDDLKKEQDTINENVGNLRDKITGIEERIATAEGDLAKLTKIKLSGYIQAQWQHLEASNAYPANLFMIRRARIKFTYEPVQGVVFVLQPDFQPGNITIKDAFAQVNEPWLKTFSLWAGKFNRPNYEVEYSSSSREVPERSRVIRAIYPDERAIGAKLEIAPPNVPLKVQLAIFNGNDGISINNPVYNYGTGKWDNVTSVGQNTDFDNYKDLMGRVTYAFKLGKIGGLTIGAHGYYGQIKANSKDVLNSDYTYDKSLENVGKGVKKNWVGFEAQLYFDFLGGLALKGEYIFGVNSTPGYSGSAKFTSSSTSLKNDTLTLTTLTTTSVNNAPAISRNFNGYYVYLVKNIGKRNQIAVRYDYYNPNTKLSADQIGTAKWDAKVADVTKDSKTMEGSDPVVVTNNQSKTVTVNKLSSGVNDIPYGTWTLGYTYFFDDNIKFMLAYEIPMNKKVGTVDANGNGNVTSSYTVNGDPGVYDYSNVLKQNTLTFRIQVKF